MNQSELEPNTRNRAKRGKTRESKSQLVWVLLLIDQETRVRFFNQTKSEVKQTKANRKLLSTLNWKPGNVGKNY